MNKHEWVVKQHDKTSDSEKLHNLVYSCRNCGENFSHFYNNSVDFTEVLRIAFGDKPCTAKDTFVFVGDDQSIPSEIVFGCGFMLQIPPGSSVSFNNNAIDKQMAIRVQCSNPDCEHCKR